MVEKLTQDKVWGFIQLSDDDFDLESLRARHDISADSSTFYTAISRLLADRKIKRLGRGKYRRIKKVEPVNWWNTEINEDPLNFLFPKSHEDESEFGIEECAEVFPGDMILIAGASNYGKTTLALNILGENLSLSDGSWALADISSFLPCHLALVFSAFIKPYQNSKPPSISS